MMLPPTGMHLERNLPPMLFYSKCKVYKKLFHAGKAVYFYVFRQVTRRSGMY